jgi:hypothetical protein
VPRHPPDALDLLDPQSTVSTPNGGARCPGTPPRTVANPNCQPARQPSRCYPLDQKWSRHRPCSAHGVFSMKTLLWTVPSYGVLRRRQSRPPRSHSQIRFTQSINTPGHSPATRQPRLMRNTRENRSSPNAVGSEVRSQTPDPFHSLMAPLSDRARRISGGERDRTDDLLLAKQALSQLSYTPVFRHQGPGPRHQKQTFLTPGS